MITGVRWTPSEHDASRYALDGPQVLDVDALDAMPASELEVIEREIRTATGMVLDQIWPIRDLGVPAARALMWLTLRVKGVGVAWAEFDPQVRKTVFEFSTEDESRPPSDAAGTSSQDTTE